MDWLLSAAAALLLTLGPQPEESLVAAPGPQGPLQGKMLTAGDGPLVLIIPGSGPTDLDGNNPLGVSAASYRLLAQALAERGISSVRIDKRGMFSSKAAVADANAVTMEDYAADIAAWTTMLRMRADLPCIWLAGHSEGGLVALLAAQKAEGICGLVLLATPGRPLGDVLREQLRANPANAPILDQALAAIGALEKGQRYETAAIHPALLPLFGPQVQGFVISLMAHDAAKLAAASGKPTLIVQGLRDLQVSEADALRLSAANPQAKLVTLPAMTHVLKDAASDAPQANLATYGDPALPLSPGLADEIAAFVKAH